MKKLNFDDAGGVKQYDKYGAFWKPLIGSHYWSHGEVAALFETGEVRINPRHPNLHDRRYYDNLGIELWASGDSPRHKFQTPDGEDVKNAWLFDRGRQQYYLIDHTHKVAVQLASWGTRDRFSSNMPKHLQGCSAYYPNSYTLPVGVPVQLSRPHAKTRAKEFVKWSAELRAICTVMERINEKVFWTGRGAFLIPPEALAMSPGDYAAKLDNHEVAQAARNGLTLGRETSEVPYLKLVTR